MSTFININGYKPKLSRSATEEAIVYIKSKFQQELAGALGLRRVTAPLFVKSGTGINDDLNGVESPVAFNIDCIDTKAEIVHSLAKWKRLKLSDPDYRPGIYTDMNAIRSFEQLDNIHSLYVDQWDWEAVIEPSERTLDTLRRTVERIFSAIKAVERGLEKRYGIEPTLPEQIHFIHSQELLDIYPGLSAKERERLIAKEHGAVFIIGIGHKLSDGEPHDLRAPDYDDWSTPNSDGCYGLNGDLIFYNPLLDIAFEISSMGIRVDVQSMLRQLAISDKLDRRKLEYHTKVLEGSIPQTIGGGIGQSRLCMFLLRKAHIGEVQSSIWPDDQIVSYGDYLM